ncbi:MAG TPA: C4-type zinc ribbon domain-containing protein [Candidatus Krumholzibacterium sp.]|nr:C4-type zinc ribbon domain-containing protein [Candidatus Krumholzibacterium sp.]
MVSAAEDIGFLIRIVQKDYEIIEKKKFLEVAPARIRALEEQVARMDEEFQADVDAIAALESEKSHLHDQIKLQNKEINDKKIARENLKTNKEYKAMGHEIEFLAGKIDEAEEKILVILDQIAVKQKELEGIMNKIDAEKDVLLQQKKDLEAQVKEYSDSLQLIEDEKLRVLPHLSKRVLNMYERICKAKGDSGVANLAGDICQGCFSRIPPQKAHEIRKNDSILTCEYCGRILVFYQNT